MFLWTFPSPAWEIENHQDVMCNKCNDWIVVTPKKMLTVFLSEVLYKEGVHHHVLQRGIHGELLQALPP